MPRQSRSISSKCTSTKRDPDKVARTLRIRPFSEAYFELLRLLPELEPIVRELDTVSVGGGRLTLAFVDDGGARLSGDRTALVRDFRAVR